MTLPTLSVRLSCKALLCLLVFLQLCGFSTRLLAQQNYLHKHSGPATITLTAVLSQSLTMRITRSNAIAPPAGSIDDVGSDTRESGEDGNVPLRISTQWVKGPGNVDVHACSPGNPRLGRAGLAIVPVENASSPRHEASAYGQSFLSPPDSRPAGAMPGLFIDTEDLEIPDGSAGKVLTIRADAL